MALSKQRVKILAKINRERERKKLKAEWRLEFNYFDMKRFKFQVEKQNV